MPHSIALLSGGLDSTVAAFSAQKEGTVAIALVIDYGQRAAKRELEAAKRVSRQLKARLEILKLPFLEKATKTSLVMNKKIIPQVKMTSLDDRTEAQKSASEVWVPNRNGLFLNIAAAIAEGAGITHLVVGFNAEEAATFPDNSANFVERAERFFEFSTLGKIKILAPTIGLNKTEIVELGKKLGVDFKDTWSCYRGNKKMCGRCESCVRSIRAYQNAGIWQNIKHRFENGNP
jgi:7-cyano-7-deazaguanine synthase